MSVILKMFIENRTMKKNKKKW